MARNVYITAMGPASGKSVVALGLMELLSARVERLGFFRPVVPADAEHDHQIELMRSRYKLQAEYDAMHAVSIDEARHMIAAGTQDQLATRVLEAYKALERDCDFVVCEGMDSTGATTALDFDLNADLANQLGCPVMMVVTGSTVGEAVAAVRGARESLERKGCVVFGLVVNRVPPELVEEVFDRLGTAHGQGLLYVLPEQPELASPTVAEVAAQLGARVLLGDAESLQRDVREVRIAAMSVEHFLEDLVDGTLVLVPGDRPDIVLATLACATSATFPPVAGIVLTAGYGLDPNVRRLLDGAPFPVLEVAARTYATATAVASVTSLITHDSERKIASALGLFEANVDRALIEHQIALERSPRMTPIMFEYELIERAKAVRRHIVLPEGDDDRILRAAEILLRRGVVDVTLLGDVDTVRARATALGLELGQAEVVNPLEAESRRDYAARYHELRRHKGVTEEVAYDTVGDVSYFGTMMVSDGAADGMVSGAVHTTGDTIRPAFEIIRARDGALVVSSVFFMCLSDGVLVYGDCAVNPNPDSEQLADIAISSAATAAMFGIEPRVAMLSYSTGESARGVGVDAVRQATELVRERQPDLKVEGPIQYDAAVDASVASLKLPGSEVAGLANVFIFPDLDTGNVAYKAVQRSAGAVAVGPVLQGLRKPVNDLSRGCTVTDIVNTVAITAIQAQEVG